MWVPVAVWQPCELLYTCYLLTTQFINLTKWQSTRPILPSHDSQACVVWTPSWQDTSSSNASSADRVLWQSIDDSVCLHVAPTIYIRRPIFVDSVKLQLRSWRPVHKTHDIKIFSCHFRNMSYLLSGYARCFFLYFVLTCIVSVQTQAFQMLFNTTPSRLLWAYIPN